MIRRLERQLLVLHLAIDVVLTLAALRLAELMRQHVLLGIEQRMGPIVLDIRIYIMAAVVWSIIFHVLPVFDSKRTTPLWHEYRGIFNAVALCVLAMTSLFYMFAMPPSRLFVAYFWLLDLGLLMGFHTLVRHVQRLARMRGYDTRNVVVVGAGPAGKAVIASIRDHAWSGLRLIGVVDDAIAASEVDGVPVVGAIRDLPALLDKDGIDEVILALPASAHETLVSLSRDLQRFPVVIKVAPDMLDVFLLRSTVTDLWGMPLLSVREPAITGVRWMLKRSFDLAIAGILGLVLLPVMALVALAIYLESGGPVLLRQERVGEHGCRFYMYKFRTMYPPSDEDRQQEASIVKRPGNPRITPLGFYLRRTSLDELPQLINVLRGEMSLVGPRPELPHIVEGYESWQHARHVVPPGMTGWWQINGRSDLPLHLNTQLDLFYIQNCSVLLDLRILARTLGVVIRGRGAY